MARLIDADVLKPTLRKLLEHYSCRSDDFAIGKCGGVTDAMDMIDALPTVDAVAVVHCRDCKYAQKTESNERFDCLLLDCNNSEFFYCMCGERRDNDGSAN